MLNFIEKLANFINFFKFADSPMQLSLESQNKEKSNLEIWKCDFSEPDLL